MYLFCLLNIHFRNRINFLLGITYVRTQYCCLLWLVLHLAVCLINCHAFSVKTCNFYLRILKERGHLKMKVLIYDLDRPCYK